MLCTFRQLIFLGLIVTNVLGIDKVPGCGGALEGSGGTLTFLPAGGLREGVWCTWVIQAPPGSHVQITLTRLELALWGNCHHGLLFASGGEGEAQRELAFTRPICGTTSPDPFVVPAARVTVALVALHEGVSRGFSLAYQAVPMAQTFTVRDLLDDNKPELSYSALQMCERGWSAVAGARCAKHLDSWNVQMVQANVCAQNGATLWTAGEDMDSVAIDEFIGGTKVWTGIKYENGVWRNQNGTPIAKSFWERGEAPKVPRNDKFRKCAVQTRGSWKPQHCNSAAQAVCIKPRPASQAHTFSFGPSPCPRHWAAAEGGLCVRHLTAWATHATQAARCKTKGGVLWGAGTDAERQQIHQLTGGHKTWTGLRYRDGAWRWENGLQTGHSFWQDGEAPVGREGTEGELEVGEGEVGGDCAVQHRGVWLRRPCGVTAQALCVMAQQQQHA